MADEQKKYAFQGKIIKLLESDYNIWRRRFAAIPDLEAYLFVLDEYYTDAVSNGTISESEIKSRWFLRASRACYNEHVRCLLRQKNQPEDAQEKDPWEVH